MAKDGIFEDTTQGDGEIQRIIDTLETATEIDVDRIIGKMRDGGMGIARRLLTVLEQMTLLKMRYFTYYQLAYSLKDQVTQLQKEYLDFKAKPYAPIIEVNEKWAALTELYNLTVDAFKTADQLPEVIIIKQEMSNLYGEYEELLLQLGGVIAPTSIDES